MLNADNKQNDPKDCLHDILVLLPSGRFDDIESASRRYIAAETQLLRGALSGTAYSSVRLVWSRGRLYTKCKNEHVSFQTLSSIASEAFVVSMANRLTVMASIKALISNLQKI